MENKVTKAYGGTNIDIELKEGSREFVATISTDRIDSDGEIVLPKGVDLARYRKNPVICANHNLDVVVGKALWIKASDKAIIAKGYVSDKTEAARDTWGLMQDGILRTFSIGFLTNKGTYGAPTKQEMRWHPEWEGAKAVHRNANLYEFSAVTVPANEDAVAMAIAKGYSKATIALLSGKTANEKKAVDDIVKAVETAEVLTAEDIRRQILKELDKIVLKVDYDSVLAKAIARSRIGM